MDDLHTIPALYLGHGAPPLLDDERWTSELARWAGGLPRPRAVLIVSAHWESAPLTLGATESGTSLTYDFYGFPERFYRLTYPSPGAPELATRVKALMPDTELVAEEPGYGLDHGAFVPLMVMYPEADVPVLQMSMPSLDPQRLFDLGARLRPLRDEGVLVDRVRLPDARSGVPHRLADRCGSPGVVARIRPVGGRNARSRGGRRADGLPTPGARHAVRAPHHGALRAAVRDPRRRERSGDVTRDRDRRVLHGPGQALASAHLNRRRR